MMLIWIPFLEYFITPLRAFAIFLFSGISGTLLSVAVSQGEGKTLGASAGIFGIFGGGLAFVMLNWKRMDHEKSPR